MSDIRAEAERVLSLANDEQYVGGQDLAAMVLAECGRVKVTKDELVEAIAIGMHTGLRKGSEAPDSAKLWRAIYDSNDSSWSDAAKYAAYCFEQMGWQVTREAK